MKIELEIQPLSPREKRKEIQPFPEWRGSWLRPFLKGKRAIRAFSLPSGRETE
jgi:hypothetical protein